MQQLIKKLKEKVLENLLKEKTPSKRTLEVIDRIIQLNSKNQK